MSSDTMFGGTIAPGLGTEDRVRWPLRRSSQLFQLRYGKALVASSRRQGDIPVFGTNGQTGAHDEALFKGPGVVVGRKGAGHLGVHWSEGDYWVIDTAYSLVPIADLDLKFAYYLVNFAGLDHLKNGTSNPSLTREAFGAQYFPVPPPSDQRSIAATLGALDDKIGSNRRAISIAHDLLDTIADRESALLPSASLGDLTSLNRATTNPSTLGDEMVDHFSLPNFDANGQPEFVSATSIKRNKIDIVGNSILVSRLNPRIDRMWWARPRPDISALASTEFAVLTASSDTELAALWLAVRDPYFREELPRRVTGTSGSHQRVRPDDLLMIDVPDVRLLDQLTKLTTLNLLGLCAARRRETAQLAALRDALLPELLSGRIRACAPVGTT